jgi:uroporphyrinogen decarboxylase
MADRMTSRERVLAAIDHREPDRLPITFDAEKEVIAALMKHFGVATRDEVWNALHVDTRLIGAKHTYHHIRREGEISYDFWGIGSKEQAYSRGTYSEYCVFPLADMETVEEVERYDWPSPDELEFEPLFEAREKNPDKAIIAHISHAGYFKACHMRGQEKFLEDLAIRPEMAEAIIRKVMEYTFPAVERMCAEAGSAFDIYYIADDFCTAKGPMISPAMFRKYIKPYLARLAHIVHSHGRKFLLHTCGSVRPLMNDIIEAGVDVLEPIQTSAVGMEPEGLKRDFGARLTFYGSIDLINVLSKGTPADVRNEVLKNFRILGKGGGFIVGPGHTYIQPDVPLENIIAMYETAYRECLY